MPFDRHMVGSRRGTYTQSSAGLPVYKTTSDSDVNCDHGGTCCDSAAEQRKREPLPTKMRMDSRTLNSRVNWHLGDTCCGSSSSGATQEGATVDQKENAQQKPPKQQQKGVKGPKGLKGGKAANTSSEEQVRELRLKKVCNCGSINQEGATPARMTLIIRYWVS